mmetsp:Transcript_59730/g.142123  ORF Transcript_59730/g.142123 Transcript_59730/m.142123 type:complete len:307 (-) Transcript_59730:390-1310(-)
MLILLPPLEHDVRINEFPDIRRTSLIAARGSSSSAVAAGSSRTRCLPACALLLVAATSGQSLEIALVAGLIPVAGCQLPPQELHPPPRLTHDEPLQQMGLDATIRDAVRQPGTLLTKRPSPSPRLLAAVPSVILLPLIVHAPNHSVNHRALELDLNKSSQARCVGALLRVCTTDVRLLMAVLLPRGWQLTELHDGVQQWSAHALVTSPSQPCPKALVVKKMHKKSRWRLTFASLWDEPFCLIHEMRDSDLCIEEVRNNMHIHSIQGDSNRRWLHGPIDNALVTREKGEVVQVLPPCSPRPRYLLYL